ncbi:hypothetical protein M6B38_354925 [Iris pallida]|uniref:Uncharacterized protein n=1 Tax=Iris pallida TaxID=29817 RepID=A0AAX6DGS7_IRIPA|nr:hypothetical protein M6B38_246135 [Iris pallida]KAJ6830235.1 hypothetical protein M6B38_354925 [Iris pallida]
MLIISKAMSDRKREREKTYIKKEREGERNREVREESSQRGYTPELVERRRGGEARAGWPASASPGCTGRGGATVRSIRRPEEMTGAGLLLRRGVVLLRQPLRYGCWSFHVAEREREIDYSDSAPTIGLEETTRWRRRSGSARTEEGKGGATLSAPVLAEVGGALEASSAGRARRLAPPEGKIGVATMFVRVLRRSATRVRQEGRPWLRSVLAIDEPGRRSVRKWPATGRWRSGRLRRARSRVGTEVRSRIIDLISCFMSCPDYLDTKNFCTTGM